MTVRKKVVWKAPPTGHVQERAKRPQYYQADAALPDHLVEKYAASLVTGSLWQVAVGSVLQSVLAHDEEPPPYPYLQGSQWEMPPGTLYQLGPVVFNRGAFAVYMGITRVSEINRNKLVTVPRHTFLLNGTMFLTKNLNDWSPVA